MRLSGKMGKMRSTLVIFCVAIFLSIDASVPNDCSKIPDELNAEVTKISGKSNYMEGDKIYFQCNHGYSSRRRISYTCINNKWTKQHNEICAPKRCELPEDIPNGQYSIVNASSFVYGVTIKYTCKEGYQMMSRHDSRTCRDGGWDNRVPVCEEVSCVPENIKTNMNVEGLPDSDEIIRYGHRLTFSCNGRGLKLNGTQHITCQLNGQWSSPFPKCVEATCSVNRTAPDLIIETNIEGPIKFGNNITFSCNGDGLKLNGPSKVTCLENGEWSRSFPTCEEVKCVAHLSEKMRSDAKEDEKKGSWISVKPQRTIMFSCLGKGAKLQGEKKITCKNDGSWNAPVPRCSGGKCGPPPTVDNADTLQMAEQEYNLRERVTYKCFEKYKLDDRPSYSDSLICQDGEWRGNVYCLKPCTVTMDEMDKKNLQPRWGGHRKMFCEHKDFISFACQRGTMRGNPRQMCSDGVMTFPECV